MNSHIFHKFSKTVDWLTHAIIEKIEGRLPNKVELHQNLAITTDETGYKIEWKNEVILLAWLEFRDEGVVAGEFEIAEKYLDDFMKDRSRNWI